MYGFRKKERLTAKKDVEALFEHGKQFFEPPLRVKWQIAEQGEDAVQVLIAVPRKQFKRAVDRNLIKRRIREAYRTQKQELTDACVSRNLFLQVAFIYMASDIRPFSEINNKMKKVLKRIPDEVGY